MAAAVGVRPSRRHWLACAATGALALLAGSAVVALLVHSSLSLGRELDEKYWNPSYQTTSNFYWFLNLPQPQYARSGGGCGLCMRQRCSHSSRCARTWGLTNARDDAYEHDACMCACCGIQCLISANALSPEVGFSPSTYPGSGTNGCNVSRTHEHAQGSVLDTSYM